MKIAGIIPARYGSSRFPGKPLVEINGKTMVQRVYEQAKQCALLDTVIIATDDRLIFDKVVQFGGVAEMTNTKHPTGTDRIGEVAKKYPEFDVFINIQGDEPFISPEQITKICECFTQHPTTQIATLIKKIEERDAITNPNVVKVVTDVSGFALYFSRSPIPYIRQEGVKSLWIDHHNYFKHIGIYGYNRSVLLALCDLEQTPLEKAESLEQLRWLENRFQIFTRITEEDTIAIDTPDDLQRILNKT